MRYSIIQHKDRYLVIDNTGREISSHATREDAEEMARTEPLRRAAVAQSRLDTIRLHGHSYDPSE